MNDPVQPDLPKAAPPNRLSIAHLMLWTLCCALVLGGYRLLLERQAPGGLFAKMLICVAALSLPLGAQVAGCVLWGYRAWQRTGGYPVQPGHWLLSVEGATAGGALLAQLAVLAIRAEFEGEGYIAPLILFLLLPGPVLGTAGYVFALMGLPEESRWWRNAIIFLIAQRILGLLSLLLIIPWLFEPGPTVIAPMGAHTFGNSTNFCCFLGLINAVYIALAAGFDPLRRQRDFLHWTGVISMIVAAVAEWSVVLV